MRRSATRWKLAALAVSGLLFVASGALLGKSPPEKTPAGAPPSTYWQGVECATCHEEVVNSFAKTRHGRAMEFGAWGELRCQSCHGEAVEHIESADPEKIKNPAKLPGREATENCLTCHASERNHQLWTGSAHDTGNVSCLDCHSAHHAKSAEKLLTTATDRDLCLGCHTDLRKAQFQRSTHLFRNEWGANRMGCVSCHQPHGSAGEKLLKEVSVNETCYQCHTEKRGPFLWEHPPARENCLNCHTPHGSNNPGLLTQRPTFLCQSCHLQGRHQTVAGRPNSTWLLNRQCLNCHPQIHGSNHPSGILYHR